MNASRILITGANGLLGQYLVSALAPLQTVVLATARGECRFPLPAREGFAYAELDITDRDAVLGMVNGFKPDVIIHGAAMTAPDPCETDREICHAVNVVGTAHMAEAAEQAGAFLVHVSTDFIFDGENGPYSEEDTPNPVNYYGLSKWEAEKVVRNSACRWAIARTVLVYGNTFGATRSHLILWVRDKVSAGERIRVVSDQVRTPTYAGDLARGVLLLAEKKIEGVFHLSGADVLTPYDMAMATCEVLGLDASLIEKVDASVFTQPARRPPRTGFCIDKAVRELDYSPLSFREGLVRMLAGNDL